ncbi:MAG: hypothetical protein AB8C84_01450 [Oligoflexales bacterium]
MTSHFSIFIFIIFFLISSCSGKKYTGRTQSSDGAESAQALENDQDAQAEGNINEDDENEILPPDEPNINLSLEDETTETKILNVNLDANIWGVGSGKSLNATFSLTTNSTVDLTKGILEEVGSLLINEDKETVITEGVEFVGQCQYMSFVSSDSSSTTTLSLSPSIPLAGSVGGSSDFEKALASTASIIVSGPYFLIEEGDHVDSLKEKCQQQLRDKYTDIIAEQIKILVEQKVVRDEREQIQSMMDSIKGGAETVFSNVNKVGGVISSVGSTTADGVSVVTGTVDDVADSVTDGAGSVIDKVGGLFLSEEENYSLCYSISVNISDLSISKERYTNCQGEVYNDEAPHAIQRAIEIAQDIALTATQYGIKL